MGEISDQEKIDIVVWDEDPITYITNALSPTKVTKVILDGSQKKCKVVVPEDQLSIAIGKGGQNVRLASKLTGYEIDIEEDQDGNKDKQETDMPEKIIKDPKEETLKLSTPKLKKKSELENSLLSAIEEHGDEPEVK